MIKRTLPKIAVKSTLLFLIIFFAADRSLGYILRVLYAKQSRGDYFQTTYAVKQAKEDLLIFGSSRAMHHYVSDILEKNLNYSSYNVGRNGRTVLYSYVIFSQILTYHKPKIVILDLSPLEFSTDESSQGEDMMVSSLLPYSSLPVIRENIKKTSKSDLILSNLFSTYAYNSSVVQLLGYYFGFQSTNKDQKGYVALKGSKLPAGSNTLKTEDNKYVKDDSVQEVLKQFLSTAKKEKVQVYVVVSPTTKYYRKTSIPEIRQITNLYGFTFFDFSHPKGFEENRFFRDATHLNDDGALKFTEFLVNKLKRKYPLNQKLNRQAQFTESEILK